MTKTTIYLYECTICSSIQFMATDYGFPECAGVRSDAHHDLQTMMLVGKQEIELSE